MSDAHGGIDEGYIKYRSRWTQAAAPDERVAATLERWRRPLFDAGLIGYDEAENVGYGNLSLRHGDSGQFVISGTQTGHLATTAPAHYTVVTATDIDANTVHCRGPVQASSEAMTHAALYALSPAIKAVVHVHSNALWRRHRDRLPTTRADVAYGTPEMAHEFERLWRETGFADDGIAVMAGHEGGLIAIGLDLAQAAERMLALDAAIITAIRE